MPSFVDLAPAIIALIAAAYILFLTWLAYRQAHSGKPGPGKAEAEAGE